MQQPVRPVQIVHLEDDMHLQPAVKRVVERCLKKIAQSDKVELQQADTVEKAVQLVEAVRASAEVKVIVYWGDYECPAPMDGAKALRAIAALRDQDPRVKQLILLTSNQGGTEVDALVAECGAVYRYKDAGTLLKDLESLIAQAIGFLPSG